MNVIGSSRVSRFPEQSNPGMIAATSGNLRMKRNSAELQSGEADAPLRSGRKKLFFALLLFLFCSAIVAAPQTIVPSKETQSEIDLVHFGDVVDVDVLGSLDFDWRGPLTPEGFLDGLDKLEERVYALCRSEPEIAADITRYYGKFLRDPKVVVKIVDRTNRAVAIIDGAIRKPQRFRIKRAVRLNELIVLSGGITDRSSGEITIYRPKSLNCLAQANKQAETEEKFVKTRQGNETQVFNIRISDLLLGQDNSNPQILSGDIVTVVEASPVYIVGGVNNPRQISLHGEMTLTRAIASAGGLSKDATADKITIFRREGRQTKTIETDLDKIQGHPEDDPVLKALDIVDVGQKGRAKHRFPPAVRTGDDPARFANLPLRVID
jgi:protein involved in polysaccharide export with SLBB domain